MSTLADSFLVNSPKKVLERAEIYTKTLQNFHQLPHAISKSTVVKRKAQEYKNDIDYAIQESEYQKNLFRKKEAQDMTTRSKIQSKIQSSLQRNQLNGKEQEKKQAKQAEEYEKHLKEVHRRYDEEERKKRQQEKEHSAKLKSQLLDFYHKEQERRKKAEMRQVQVGTCYQSALQRINSIHRHNEQYALKAQLTLTEELNRNNHQAQLLSHKRRSLSSKNQRKAVNYRQSLDNQQQREHRFIQKCGSNEEASLSAWKHIDQEAGKTTKRIGEFFKKRYQRWSNDKKRVDEANQQISERCTGILSKTDRAAFRQTVSTFRNTAQQWSNIVDKNKSAIREFDQMEKDKIMEAHLDLRLTNHSSAKITDRMKVMRLQAKKLAYDFL